MHTFSGISTGSLARSYRPLKLGIDQLQAPAPSYREVKTLAERAITQHKNELAPQLHALQELSCALHARHESQAGCPTNHCLPPITLLGLPQSGPCSATKHPFTVSSIDPIPLISIPEGHRSPTTSLMHAGHEFGHTIGELTRAIVTHSWNLHITENQKLYPNVALARYLQHRSSEIFADVLSLLYMGPASAYSLIELFKSLRQGALLSDLDRDEHPADVLRVMILAAAIDYLNISPEKKKNHFQKLRSIAKLYFVSKRVGCTFDVAMQVITSMVNHLFTMKLFPKEKSLSDLAIWDEKDEDGVSHFTSTNQTILSPPKSGLDVSAIHVIVASFISQKQDEESLIAISRQLRAIRQRDPNCNQCDLVDKREASSSDAQNYTLVILSFAVLCVVLVVLYLKCKKRAATS